MEETIEFIRTKDYKKVKNIGQGGTGKTILLLDPYINEKFVCKKYSPYYAEHRESYYKNFVDEIKILHKVYHDNVVRVFNYYLYPEQKTGYILMEYVNGESINDFVAEKPEDIDELFVQTILGFKHLEENEILHRDIRPDNVLVSNKGIVKIIDFGFGKKTNFNENFDNSVSLNWRYSIPKDFEEKVYNFSTEVYFVGKLFEEIIQNNELSNFKYSSILLKMIEFDPKNRISSFFEIYRKIIGDDISEINFSHDEKQSYLVFAHELSAITSKVSNDSEYRKDINEIEKLLNELYRNSMLEEYIQDNSKVINCFIRGNYYYRKDEPVNLHSLRNFIKMLSSSDMIRKRIIMNNIWSRLDSIPKYDEVIDDDLPF